MSTLVHEVAALPGGAAVGEVLGRLDDAVPDVAHNLARTWRRIGDGCADVVPALSRVVADTGINWSGNTATALAEYTRQLVSAGYSLSRTALAAAEALDDAAVAVARAQRFVRSRSEWLLSWVRSQDAAYPEVDRSARETAISTVCRYVAREMHEVVDRSEHELDSSLRLLMRAVGDVGSFSGIRRLFLVSPEEQDVPSRARPEHSVPRDRGAAPEARPPTQEPAVSRPSAPADVPTRWDEPHAGEMPTRASEPGGFGDTQLAVAEVDHGGGPPEVIVSGDVADWIAEALRILERHGVDVDSIDPADIATIIQHESSGDPHAINRWDANAAAGHPSKGVMQTIPSTFNAYNLPGYGNIWNPVHNIIAAVRYALDRYGSIDNVPGLNALESGQSYVGY